MPPYRTSVVRLVAYRKEEFVDRHQPHAPPAADPHPFLFLLSPDTLQLVTGTDAAEGQPAASLLQQVSMKPSDRAQRRVTVRPLALLHKLVPQSAHGTHSGAAGDAGDAAGEAPEDAPPQRPSGEELGEELEEGQLLTFSIALSQVAELERDERRIKILFCRQRPHRSTESNDDWKAVWKAMAFPLAYPYEGLKHRNFSVRGYMQRHYRDPLISSVVLEADSPQEAAALHQAVEEAISRLAQAVHWLSQDLPLDAKPVVTLVTAVGGADGGAASEADEVAAAGAASPLSSPGAATAYSGPGLGQEQIVCPFPRMQQPLDIPVPAATAASSGAGSSAASSSQDEGSGGTSGGRGSMGGAGLAVNVWLHSPLGPAVATITQEQLRQSAGEGGAPVCVVALPHGKGQEAGPTPTSRDTLEVILQFTATWRPATRRLSSGTKPLASSNTSSAGVGSLPAMLACLCVPLLAAWLQLLADGLPAIRVLQSVAFLLSCLAALAAIVVLQLKGRTAAPSSSAAPATQATQPAGWWRLVLLHADLVRESRQQTTAGAPTVQRLVSSSRMSLLPAAALQVEGGAIDLPAPIKRLVADHPVVLNDDIAARFLVGMGHADAAYQALRKMVEWVEAQGVADLVNQAQPRFEVIKKHYPQVFFCWSRSADCILEIERTGQWRSAFETLKALGVTERELLCHQVFTMEYLCRVLDSRPLPQGKTVKIIDLEGLSMRDVTSTAFKWYLQVGGAVLAVNYPQRLHKAFLLNAPAWSGVIWKVLASFVPRRTREQLQLFTKNQHAQAARALLQWVPADQLPQRYGGSCTVPLVESELEQQMLAYVRQLNQQAEGGVREEGMPGGSGNAQYEAFGSTRGPVPIQHAS